MKAVGRFLAKKASPNEPTTWQQGVSSPFPPLEERVGKRRPFSVEKCGGSSGKLMVRVRLKSVPRRSLKQASERRFGYLRSVCNSIKMAVRPHEDTLINNRRG